MPRRVGEGGGKGSVEAGGKREEGREYGKVFFYCLIRAAAVGRRLRG